MHGAPANGGPVFLGTFLGCCFFITISELALPGLMLKYERGQYRKIDKIDGFLHIFLISNLAQTPRHNDRPLIEASIAAR